jgi:hypothetical protein
LAYSKTDYININIFSERIINKQNSIIKMKKNYKTIFFMGITFVGVGVVFMVSVNVALGAAFIALGAVNMIIGGKHKDRWKKQ